MDDKPNIPARGERFVDPAARAVWAAISALDRADQHDILEELQLRLAVMDLAATPREENEQIRVARAIASLREAAKALGCSPSLERYESLRKLHREYGWAPAGSIRRWLGGASWNDCLRRAHLDAHPDGDIIVAPLGPRFSPEEILDAIKECSKDLGGRSMTLAEYCAWAKRPDVKARLGRRPLSQGPVDRAFGGFPKARAAAFGSKATQAIRSEKTGFVRSANYIVSNDDITRAIREVGDRLGHTPRSTEYERERERVISESLEAGNPRMLPCAGVIYRRFHSWDEALVAAGFERLGGRKTTKGRSQLRNGPLYSDEELLSTLRKAYEKIGPPFTIRRFLAWRKREVERLEQAEPWKTVHVPGHEVMQARFGSWAETKRRALDSPPAKGDEDDGEAGVEVVAA
jgi:hypothetical protein